MPKATITKHFDYMPSRTKMYSYPPGEYADMPQAHYDAAVEQGKVKGVEAPADHDHTTMDAQQLADAHTKDQLVVLAKQAGVTELDGTKAELAERIVATR